MRLSTPKDTIYGNKKQLFAFKLKANNFMHINIFLLLPCPHEYAFLQNLFAEFFLFFYIFSHLFF